MVIVIRKDDGSQFIHTGKITSRIMDKIRKELGFRKPPRKSYWNDYASSFVLMNYYKIPASEIAEQLTEKIGKRFTKNMVISKYNRMKESR